MTYILMNRSNTKDSIFRPENDIDLYTTNNFVRLKFEHHKKD